MRNSANSPVEVLQASKKQGVRYFFLIAMKVVAILALLQFTNPDIMDRVNLLLDNDRYATLLPYIAIWCLSLMVLMIAAFQPQSIWRWSWAILLSLSAATAWGYRFASHNELSAYDILSLWEARHEVSRASQMYAKSIYMGFGVFFASLAILGFGPVVQGTRLRKWLTRLVWTPLIPIVVIAGIVFYKSGGGSQALPVQFTSLSLGALTGYHLAVRPSVSRHEVAWTPKAENRIEKIVFLVDESIRADYVSLVPENVFTPRFAAAGKNLIDYGRATSGGNCSHYSEATLRFMVNPSNVVTSATTNPTMWDYALKAGYRTVFVDGHTGTVSTASEMQNFMTLNERRKIGSFIGLHKLKGEDADDKVLKIIVEELAKPGPVFIFANKNGAHFPYDSAYKLSEAQFRPSIAEAGADTPQSRVNSYLNAVVWTVDRLMPGFIAAAESNKAAFIYTSDHGQIVQPGGLTHCQVDNPDPRTALVPLMLDLPPGPQRQLYVDAAVRLKDKANHYMIAPTVLSFMGYDSADVQTVYKSSLLMQDGNFKPSFTTGDIFGLFSDEVKWNPIDVSKDMLEAPAKAILDGSAGKHASSTTN